MVQNTPVRNGLKTPDPAHTPVASMVESIVGCKWSVHLLQLLAAGCSRPSALLRASPGLSAKVMNERLKKMIRFGIVSRSVAGEKPPVEVDYLLTPFGSRFNRIVREVQRVEDDSAGDADGSREDHAPPPFHLAIQVRDLAEARAFYGGLLGCPEGRSAENWVDFNFFGHQLVCHRTGQNAAPRATNPVDGHDVPTPHFGAVLDLPEWRALAARLEQAGVRFVIEPHVRFEGKPGEQATLFLLDPSGNALEFKAFADRRALFRK